MRLKLALVAVAATLSTMLMAPSTAQAADSIACSAVGSYSRVINNTAYTFWLVRTYGSYRYWHVEWLSGSAAYYDRSYVVRCSGSVITGSADLVPVTDVPARCNPQSTLTYQYMGARDSYLYGTIPWPSRFHYWHVYQIVFPSGNLVYHHSEVARC